MHVEKNQNCARDKTGVAVRRFVIAFGKSENDTRIKKTLNCEKRRKKKHTKNTRFELKGK